MSSHEYARARQQQTVLMRQGSNFSGYERNCCFLNTGTGRFADISSISGLDYPDDGRAVATVDWDGDGDLDLWLSNRNAPRLRLMRNDAADGNRWVSFRLVGDGKTSPRDAIGARVQVLLRDQQTSEHATLVKTLRAAEGFLSQSAKSLHFGLGANYQIETVTVQWPGGAAQSYDSIAANTRHTIIQQQGGTSQPSVLKRALSLQPKDQRPNRPSSIARIPLVSPVPTLPLTYEQFDTGRRIPLAIADGHHTLVLLWASWCQPCLVELRDLAKRKAQLEAANMHVFALSVDQVDDRTSSQNADADFIRQISFPYFAGRADKSCVQDLQFIHDAFVNLTMPLPLPTSFLIDTRGRVTTIYKGPLSVDQLLKDARRTSKTHNERFLAAAQLPGSIVDSDRVNYARKLISILPRQRLAAALTNSGRYKAAIAHFDELVALAPDVSSVRFGLGDAYLRRGHVSAAAVALTEALRIDPNNVEAQLKLALAFQKQREYRRAIHHYRLGLALEPSFIEGANNLAWLLATVPDSSLRDATAAIRWAEACASATKHRNPGILDSLAAAYAEAGRFSEAVKWQTRAVQLVPPSRRAGYVSRLQEYQLQKPHRLEAKR